MAAPRECQVVGGDQRGELVLAMQPGDQIENGFCRTGVQVSGGFVRKKEFWAGDKSPGQRHALLFAAGKLS